MIFWLNWNKDVLYGWEKEKSMQCVSAIIEGIKHSDEFPPVYIYQIKDRVYSIVGEKYVDTAKEIKIKDGGHTRAIGHFIESVPLKCELVRSRPYIMPGYFDPYGTVEIKDIVLIDDVGQYLKKKEYFPKYRQLQT